MTQSALEPLDLDGYREPTGRPARRWRPVDLVTGAAAGATLIAAVVSAIALSQTSSLSAAPATPATPTDLSVLAGSQAALRSVSTLRLTSSAHEEIAGQNIKVSIGGVIDNVHKAGAIEVTIAGKSFEERFVGDFLYLKVPADLGGSDTRPWESVALASVLSAKGQSELTSPTDPASSLGVLKGLTDVRRVGSETFDGVDTEHFRGTATAGAGASLFRGDSLPAQALAALAGQSITEDIYLGHDGLVRRLRSRGTLTVGGQSLKLDATVGYSDFNAPVSVTAPPADQVRAGVSLPGFPAH